MVVFQFHLIIVASRIHKCTTPSIVHIFNPWFVFDNKIFAVEVLIFVHSNTLPVWKHNHDSFFCSFTQHFFLGIPIFNFFEKRKFSINAAMFCIYIKNILKLYLLPIFAISIDSAIILLIQMNVGVAEVGVIKIFLRKRIHYLLFAFILYTNRF